MAKDDPKYPGVRMVTIHNVATTASSTTATLMFGGDIWKAPTLPVERPAADNPIYAQIGQVASDWAAVEHTFDLIIWKLANVEPEAGACITAQMMSVFPRCKAIIALLTLHQRTTAKDMSSLIGKVTELSQKASAPGDKRNRIVHDPWFIYSDSAQQTGQFKAMPHKDYRYGVHPVDQNDLKAALTEIKNFSDRVTAFRAEILKMLGS